MILTPTTSDGGGGGAGKTPSSNRKGTSNVEARIENTTLKQRCHAALLTRRSIGHRLPSQRTTGVSAAQTYMPVIQPTNTYFHGTAPPRYSRGTVSWMM